jgi:diguanylate cyclase (GGDEF)-like protein
MHEEPTEQTTALVLSERPRAGNRVPMVMIISGPNIGSQAELGSTPLDIGRHPSCGLVIASSSVSRRHASIEPVDGGHLIRDLDSKNGTLVNGTRVASQMLCDGDLVKVGKAVIKFAALGNLDATYYRKLAEISATDSLTGAANRRFFDDTLRLTAARAGAAGQALSLVLFDFDHFKRINDDIGHVAGDHVLREATRLVRQQIRGTDLLARVGGEEFAILCPGAHEGTAVELAEKIRCAVELSDIRFGGQRIVVTVSMGVAVLPPSTDPDAAALYGRADAALYASKRGGRNRVTCAPDGAPSA